MLELRNLRAGYAGAPVLEGLSAACPGGMVTAVVGPNGSGKSTLLKAIAGILPSQGEILLDGAAISGLAPKLLARKVAFLPQSRPVPEITAERLVLHGRFPYLSYPRQYRETDRRIAREAMAQLGIGDLAGRSLGTLSGGQRQKVYLAMALAQDTPVVLLDEPTTYLDIAHQMQLMALARLLADQGKTVVLVLHDLPLALAHADRLLVLAEGNLAAQGDPEAVYACGCLSRVFSVPLHRIQTPDGWKYYY